jgi:hypothetical protein
VLDPQGKEYPRAEGPLDGQPDLVVLSASINTDTLPAGLYDTENRPLMNAVLQVTELTVGMRPVAVDARNPANLVILRGVPPGRYGVTVVQSTGQVWRVPNELSPMTDDNGLPRIPSQGFFFQTP